MAARVYRPLIDEPPDPVVRDDKYHQATRRPNYPHARSRPDGAVNPGSQDDSG